MVPSWLLAITSDFIHLFNINPDNPLTKLFSRHQIGLTTAWSSVFIPQEKKY